MTARDATPDAGAIWRGLSPAQQRALLWLPADGGYRSVFDMLDAPPPARVRMSLFELGLMCRNGPRGYHATDLGRAVRTAGLAAARNEGGEQHG